MPDLAQRVLAFIRQEHLIEPHESVLVGVSGGIDSTALLSLLHSLKDTIPCNLAVAHVNHMLRGPESERDESFVREIAEQLVLPFHVGHFNVKALAEEGGKSIQHAGRDIRYDYFQALLGAHAYDRIAIAHNQDDQVETFVLRVIKGTGMRGLSCIPVKRGSIIRPFLATTRNEIEQYVIEKNIRYVEDSSNRKDAYERNYVRHKVLPSMEKLNPKVHRRIMDLMGDLTKVNERLSREASALARTYASNAGEGIIMPVKELREWDEERRFRVLSLVLGQLAPGFIALREHIGLIDKVLASPRPNGVAVLPWGIRARREYERLICTTAPALIPVLQTFALETGHNRIEPLGMAFDLAVSDGAPAEYPADRFMAFVDAAKVSRLSVRTFRDGDRFVPLGMKGSVKLKDYFISRKIPKSVRRVIPLMITGDTIVWVVGERLDDRFKVTEETTKVLVVTARKLSIEEDKPTGT